MTIAVIHLDAEHRVQPSATECPRCGAEYRRGNHQCRLADGSAVCYECAIDIDEPIMAVEAQP